MIPILYESTEQDFITNGLGRLPDALECTVTEERNGAYELFMRYPTNGQHYADLSLERYIYAAHDDTKVPQPFRIYRITKPLNGIVSVFAEHMSYLLSKVIVQPFTATTCTDAMGKLEQNAIGGTDFSFWTDKGVTANFKVETPQSIRSLLAGQSGSILDVYGTGEYEFDHREVKLYLHRGSDSGVTIRYGKNITDLEADTDMTTTYTAIVPFWTDGETTVMLPERILYAGTQYAETLAKAVDLSGSFEEEPTAEQLRAKAQSYLNNNQGWVINQNISVNFVQLWQTKEYANYAPLQRVKLCDTVTVTYTPLDVSVTAKVVKVVYDVLLERYNEIEIGDARSNMNEAVEYVTDDATKDLVNRNFLEKSIDRATSLITGGLGGYVRFMYNADGEPEEILIMDEPDVARALKVWRWNKNGLGFSSTGYSGEYRLALTADGKIVADAIDTGHMRAERIQAGILQALSGYVQFNLDTGFIYTKDLSLPLWTGSGRIEAVKLHGFGMDFCEPDGTVNTSLESTGLHRKYDINSTQFGLWLESDGTSPYYDVSVQLTPDGIFLHGGTGQKVVLTSGTKLYATPNDKGLTGTAHVKGSDGNNYYLQFCNGILIGTDIFTDNT